MATKKKGVVTIVGKYKCIMKPYINIKDNWTKIPNNTFKVLNGKVYEFYVYSYLCKNFNKDNGYAFPSKKAIANDLGISYSSVNRAIKFLEENNLIKTFKSKTETGKWVNNCYVINYVEKIVEETIEYKTELSEETKKAIEEYYSSYEENEENEDIIINENEDYEDYNPDMWEEFQRQQEEEEREEIIKRLKERDKNK